MLQSVSKILFWSSTLVCVVAQTMVIRSLVLGRTPGSVRTSAARVREAAWILIPAVGLAVVLVLTWRAVAGGRSADPPAVPLASVEAAR